MSERPFYTGTYVMNDADSLVCVLKVAFHIYGCVMLNGISGTKCKRI